MPEDFRPRVKNPKNSEPNINARSEIDEDKSTEPKKSTKKKKIMCFGIVLTLFVIPAVAVPIIHVLDHVSYQKKNADNVSTTVNNVTNNNVTVNNVQVKNVEVQNKGFAQKKIIKDGNENFVMTKKQVELIAQSSAMIFNSLANNAS